MKSLQEISTAIRDIPDFPKKGIVFKDITPILLDPEFFASTIEHLAASIANRKTEVICGIESRGFIFGAALALKLGIGFVPIRKPGKLPYKTFKEEYALEYGRDAVEIHQDAIKPGERVLLVDDLLATGGTARAAVKLIEKCGGVVDTLSFVVELGFLKGIEKLEGYNVQSLIEY